MLFLILFFKSLKFLTTSNVLQSGPKNCFVVVLVVILVVVLVVVLVLVRLGNFCKKVMD